MPDIYLHFLCAHYGLYGNAPVADGVLVGLRWLLVRCCSACLKPTTNALSLAAFRLLLPPSEEWENWREKKKADDNANNDATVIAAAVYAEVKCTDTIYRKL